MCVFNVQREKNRSRCAESNPINAQFSCLLHSYYIWQLCQRHAHGIAFNRDYIFSICLFSICCILGVCFFFFHFHLCATTPKQKDCPPSLPRNHEQIIWKMQSIGLNAIGRNCNCVMCANGNNRKWHDENHMTAIGAINILDWLFWIFPLIFLCFIFRAAQKEPLQIWNGVHI